jgi:uncharacterized protein YqeY
MRAKDTNRLDVLRGVLAEITNASKTDNPPTTDVHILSIIRKARTKSEGSAQEFEGAGREDLAEKEKAQIAILEEYAGQVETVSKEEIDLVVAQVTSKMDDPKMNPVMKGVMDVFKDKPVVKAEVAAAVKSFLKLLRKVEESAKA